MRLDDFRKHAHTLVDWMADYLQNIEEYPVKSTLRPGDIVARIAEKAPTNGEPFEQIWADFREQIMPGIVHWQHPGFMAYFPANSSPPSVLAEMITATLANQCMIWDTSPAAAELEEQMMEWLKDLLNLPADFSGVIQDTASTATLVALLCARERISEWTINERGIRDACYRVYASSETHSSIEKGVKIAGLGSENYVIIKVDAHFRLDPEDLENRIKADLAAGFVPTCVVATVGTTGVTAIDSVDAIGKICARHNIWLHVDAAYAGTALILPEYQWMAKGLERCDSFVFNPHKWMFTNFDCTAYYVKDKSALVRTLAILPEYLKYAGSAQVNDYRDWGIPLGRRFRALKLWFVLRTYGVEGIREKLRHHLALSGEFEAYVRQHDRLVLMAPRTLNLVCFRYAAGEPSALEQKNRELLGRLNGSGRFYVTHTRVNGTYCIRVVIGQTYVTKAHLESLIQAIDKIIIEFHQEG